jgi:uncharacterized protein
MMRAALVLLALFVLATPVPGVLANPLPDAPRAYTPELAAEMSAEEQRLEAGRHLQMAQPDLVEARRWLEAAAEGGSVEAMGAVGWLYQQGLGVEPDADRALDYYTQAYEAGEDEYGLRIAWMHVQGLGMEPDRIQGEEWFRRVIDERDNSAARLALATLLVSDAMSSLRPDRAAEARDLLTRALDDGMEEAAYYLARMHIEGVGNVPADRGLAARYTRMGAEAGNPQMQAWMAVLHARGEGVPMDLVEAHKWASLAASGGDPTGEQLRRELGARLERTELHEARRRALLWINEH